MWGSKKGISRRIDSLIGRSTKIMGDLDFTGGLLVDGQVLGNVTAIDDEYATMTISENGYVQGEIQIPNIIINGTVKGDVYASNHVELAKKARVFGNVYYHLFEMAMGAEVNGNLVHLAQDEIKPNVEIKSEPARLEEPNVLTVKIND
jgi:cytoskeletal protein CcmA (bactofilin family)